MCSISYEPCTEQSFRIGQRNPTNMDNMQDVQNVNMGLMESGMNPMMTGILNAFVIFNELELIIFNSCSNTYSNCSSRSASGSSSI